VLNVEKEKAMIDILGTIYEPGTYDEEGNELTPPTPLPGYHVNAVCSIPAFLPFIITPTTPTRVFGDIEHTVFLQFADRDEWLSLGIEYTDEEGNQAFDTSALQAELDVIKWRKTAECTALQAELAIDAAGLTDHVEAIKDNPNAPLVVKKALEKAYKWSRRSPLWDDYVEPELGLTPEQIDALFVQAQAIDV